MVRKAKTARDTRAPCTREPPGTPHLYLGCFRLDKPGEEAQVGSFQIVVEGSSPSEAADRCLARIRALRASSTLFQAPSTIYLEGLIRLTGSFQRGLLVNYEFRNRPEVDVDWQIGCMIPEQDDHDAEAFGRKPKKNGDDEPFVDFGGEKAAHDLAAAAAKRAESAGQNAVQRRLPPHPAPERASAARSDSSAVRAERRAAREREKQSKREQQETLANTLAELGMGTGREPR